MATEELGKIKRHPEVTKWQCFLSSGVSYNSIKFQIACQSCLAVIRYRSDAKINDYTIPENGAICTFCPECLSKQESERIKRQREEEEADSPMLIISS